jgi:hypothetical protein
MNSNVDLSVPSCVMVESLYVRPLQQARVRETPSCLPCPFPPLLNLFDLIAYSPKGVAGGESHWLATMLLSPSSCDPVLKICGNATIVIVNRLAANESRARFSQGN